MYCSNCGHQNPDGGKYCESCGSVLDGSTAKKTSPQTAKIPLRKLASIGGALVIICFFLPWVMVSCSSSGMLGEDIEIKASGFELATGKVNDLKDLYGQSQMLSDYDLDQDASPVLFIIPLLGIGGLIALNDKKSGIVVALVCALLGMVSLIIFGNNIHQLKEEYIASSYGMLSIHYQPGFYLVWIGFVVQAGFGLITYRKEK